MIVRQPLFWLALAAAFAVMGCANPRAPSGGPRDETPPAVVNTRPARDTVNVPTDTRSVRLTFSEYVERTTISSALSITPSVDGRVRFDWSGRTVEVELPTTLRDSTTYIFTVGTELTDAHGVSLESPITVAFSTGPRINQGELRGRVVRPKQGQPVPRADVFAYALSSTAPRRMEQSGRPQAFPDSLPDQPAYRTQTGEDGQFAFDYLREQRYYVVALRDNNRNRRPDPSEPTAAPPHPALPADSGAAVVPVPWLLTQVDTTGPSLQRAEPLNRRRLRLSFDEPVRLGAPAGEAWTLRDSSARQRVPVRAAYEAPGRSDAIVLRTAPMDPKAHQLPVGPALVTDTLGQGAVPDTARIQSVAKKDTMRTRFQTFLPENTSPDTAGIHPLLPDISPGVRFNQSPDSSALARALSVRDTTGRRPYTLGTDNGRAYRVQMTPPLAPGGTATIVVDARALAGPDTTYQRRVRRVTRRRLGGVEGRALRSDTTLVVPDARRPSPDATRSSIDQKAQRIAVQLRPEQTSVPVGLRQQAVVPGSTFVFEELPEGTFRFRAFLDRNADGRWTGGRVVPYRPPEPLTWSRQPADTRPRWTTVLPAPLRVPTLRLVSPNPPLDTTARPDSLQPELPADTSGAS